MATRFEHTLEFPTESVKKFSGFSVDIGGSVCKVVYRHKDDWEELQKMKTEPKMTKIRLTSFRSEDADQAFKMLKENCHIHRSDDTPVPMVYTTGLGGNAEASQLQEVLNVKSNNLSEFDCFIDGFIYLSRHIPMDKFITPLNQELLQQLATTPGYRLPRPLGTGVEFPVVLFMCGSALVGFKIEANGNYNIVEFVNHGGRTFIGIGSLLTGAKTYDGLIDLAEKGDTSKVDKYSSEFDKTGEEEDNVERGDVNYHFYKAIGKKQGDFKPEDLALSLIHMTTQQIAQMVFYATVRSNCRHAFFCGSLFNRDLIRDNMTSTLANMINYGDAIKNKEDLGFHFIRGGGHLGAIGALINSLGPEPATTSETK